MYVCVCFFSRQCQSPWESTAYYIKAITQTYAIGIFLKSFSKGPFSLQVIFSVL